MRFPNFVGGSYLSPAITADQERTVNLYVERQEARGATTEAMLHLIPGLQELEETGGTHGRAHFYESGREFAIIGLFLVEFDKTGVGTERGTLGVDSLDAYPGTICSNGDGGGQLLVVAGGNAFCLDLTTNLFTEIAALHGKATMGSYLDGYGIVLDADTSTMYISALLDFTSWTTGTDFAQRTKAPDKWRAMRVNGSYIGLFGEHTSEFWYNTGDASFPFAPHPSGYIPQGIAAPWSLAVAEGTQFWLAQSGAGQYQVMRSDSFRPEPISTFPMQHAIPHLLHPGDAVGDVINWRGHLFYRLTFAADRKTYVYDVSTNTWFEWLTFIGERGEYEASRAQFPVVAFGEYRVLDRESGKLYRLRDDVHQDVQGRYIRWMRRTPAAFAENQRIFVRGVEVFLDEARVVSQIMATVGSEMIVNPVTNPMICMRMSVDGGRNWGPERWRSAGKTGEYGIRARWERLGSGRRVVFEFTGSDPFRWMLTGASLHLAQPVGEESAA